MNWGCFQALWTSSSCWCLNVATGSWPWVWINVWEQRTATYISNIHFRRSNNTALGWCPLNTSIDFFTACEVSQKCFSTLPNWISTLMQILATNLYLGAFNCRHFQGNELRNRRLYHQSETHRDTDVASLNVPLVSPTTTLGGCAQIIHC